MTTSRWSKLLVVGCLLAAGCRGTDKYPERIVGNWRPVSGSTAGGGQMRLDEDGTIEEVAPGGVVRKGTYRFVKRDTIEVSFPEMVKKENTKEKRTRSRWPALEEERRIVSLGDDELVLAGEGWKLKYTRAKRFP